MLDTINDGYIDPFDWTTRLLDILRIQFKNDDLDESAENLVEAKQYSSQRLLVSISESTEITLISDLPCAGSHPPLYVLLCSNQLLRLSRNSLRPDFAHPRFYQL